ncbi:MAG: symmetrical bis(5'-nucleosyl)-tetraphosphatase [Gammaproteobacteria bacterium]|nr:MAG: symmetrical bis(5'-nucleosyl)-tetraphosphatase [Gammaproteobacteria bacterium]
MAVYAIGDVQGCFKALQSLLNKIRFDKNRDRLWFTGDLVNRGPQSLEVLRFVKSLGSRAVTVLGNHDLHLLAISRGHATTKEHDTLGPVLDAPDKDELLNWLRSRPLMFSDLELGISLIHAGLLPQWTIEQARLLAKEVECVLQGSKLDSFLENMYGNKPDCWSENLKNWERLRIITNSFSRLRYCDAEGRMDFHNKGAPGTQPAGLIPWFEVPGRRTKQETLVFGHWSTLPVNRYAGCIALDSGCLWGGRLTAVRIDTIPYNYIDVECKQHHKP